MNPADTGPPSSATGQDRPKLHCLQGQAAPDAIVGGWDSFIVMRTSAQQAFVELLVDSILETDEAALGTALHQFCETHGVSRDEAFAALKAAQFLLHRAAASDLDTETFAADLQALSPDAVDGLRLLGTRYAPLKQRIREELLLQTLSDHGKVLRDLNWRLDTFNSSDRVVGLRSPVVFLTLQLEDAGGQERVTVQLTPQSVQMLQRFCQRFSDSG